MGDTERTEISDDTTIQNPSMVPADPGDPCVVEVLLTCSGSQGAPFHLHSGCPPTISKLFEIASAGCEGPFVTILPDESIVQSDFIGGDSPGHSDGFRGPETG